MTTFRRYTVSASIAVIAVLASVDQASGSDRVPAALAAQHAVCRALFAANGTAQVICYIAFAEEISGSMFSGPPSEATAFLTVRTDAIASEPIANGNIAVLLQSAGTYDVYFNSTPHGDWSKPDSFSSGQLVATFARTAPLLVNVGTMANGFFSARLINSEEFVLNGRTVDFGRIVPNGLTWILTAASTPIPGPPGFVAAQAFAGTALSVGR